MANRTQLFGGDLESATGYIDDNALLRNPDKSRSVAMEPLQFKEPLQWRRRPSFTDLIMLILRRVKSSHFRTKLLNRICLLIVCYLSFV